MSSGEPDSRWISGFFWTTDFTTQKRRYPHDQMRISVGFQRPMSNHFTPTGTTNAAVTTAPVKARVRR